MNRLNENAMEKLANELEEYSDVANAENVLTKLTFAKSALNVLDRNQNEDTTMSKTAAASDIAGTMSRALVAGIGLGLAGEAVGYADKKIKKMLFDHNLNKLTKEVKKVNPELSHTNDEDVKRLMRAGYTLAPEIMQNPTLASSFVSVGKSLGGKIDPNTMKLFADAGNKARRDSNLTEPFAGAGDVMRG